MKMGEIERSGKQTEAEAESRWWH